MDIAHLKHIFDVASHTPQIKQQLHHLIYTFRDNGRDIATVRPIINRHVVGAVFKAFW